MSESWIDSLKEEGGVKPRKTLAEEAADNLREFILLGKLAPGTAIPERDLAEALGVSRTPLREALRLLVERDELVALKHQAIRAKIAEGIDQAEAGILVDGEEAVTRVRKKINQQKKQKSSR